MPWPPSTEGLTKNSWRQGDHQAMQTGTEDQEPDVPSSGSILLTDSPDFEKFFFLP